MATRARSAKFKGKRDAEGNPLEYYNGIPARNLTSEDIDGLSKEQYKLIREGDLYELSERSARTADNDDDNDDDDADDDDDVIVPKGADDKAKAESKAETKVETKGTETKAPTTGTVGPPPATVSVPPTSNPRPPKP